MLLSELSSGQKARIIKISGAAAVTARLLDMGVVGGTVLELIRKAPLGDPLEIKIRNFLLSLRKAEANIIQVEPL